MTSFRPWVLITLVIALAGCGASSSNIKTGPKPKGASFYGVWQSPQYGSMHLCQSENGFVVGDFQKDERLGRIYGKPKGDILTFKWEDRRELIRDRPVIKKGRGYFRLSKGDDGDQYLTGEWGFDENMIGGGPWNAARMRGAVPNRCYGDAPDLVESPASSPLPED